MMYNIYNKEVFFMKKKSEILIYKLPDGSTNVEVLLDENDMWLNKEGLITLFQTSRQNIEKHIKHIYEDEELTEKATCNSKLLVQNEGTRKVKRVVKYYNLKEQIFLLEPERYHML